MNTKEVLTALSIVKPGLSNKDLTDQATFFVFKKGRVITYNDHVTLSHPLDVPFEGAIRANEMYQFLSKINTEEIDVIEKDEEIQIKAKRAKAGLKIEEIRMDTSQVEKKRKWIQLEEGFIDSLRFVVKAASTDATTPAITCVHIADGIMEASDRFRGCMAYCQELDECMIPEYSIPTIVAISPTHICVEDEWVSFKNKESDTILSCRIFVADDFPNLEPLFEESDDGIELTLPNKRLGAIVDKAAIFAKREFQFDEQLTITLSDKRMTLLSESNAGWFEEEVKIKYKGPEITFNIIPYLFSDILKEDNTSITLYENKIIFEYPDHWKYSAILARV